MRSDQNIKFVVLAGAAVIAWTSPSLAAQPKETCPDIKTWGNHPQEKGFFAWHEDSGTTSTYYFQSPNEPSTNGVPGLIQYCVNPVQPPANPPSIVVDPNLKGADGTAWEAGAPGGGNVAGPFSFRRPGGNPTNLPYRQDKYTMGTATWPDLTPAPSVQDILLHINDTARCTKNEGEPTETCWIRAETAPPPKLCEGQPACKVVQIDWSPQISGSDTNPITVPGKTLLHLHYTYYIVNQPENSFSMIFKFPNPGTQDINSGGGKDYFGCEQEADNTGMPGSFNSMPILDYDGSGFTGTFMKASGGGCAQHRFTVTAPNGGLILKPGEYKTFHVDTVTRQNSGGNQEFTSCGLKVLNSGFTVKWFQTNDTLLHSFSTHNNPLQALVVSSPNLTCP